MIYALVSQKGGTGKTTTAASLAFALGQMGKKVLLVDIDPQGSLGTYLGIEPDDLELTIYNALLDDDISLKDVAIRDVKPGVDFVPANIDLSVAELEMMSQFEREKMLRKLLRRFASNYDAVFIDCPPSLSLLTINAMTAAHEIIIPVSCAFLSLRGLKHINMIMEKMKKSLNPKLEIRGVVLTQVDRRTRHANQVIDRVRDFYGKKVFKTMIPHTVRFDEAPVSGKTILEYEPNSVGAIAYKKLAREVLK